MSTSKIKYIASYNRENYKQYIVRVRKDQTDIVEFLDAKQERNQFLLELIKKEMGKIYSIREIREIITPILKARGIKRVYLFGSYARGEATSNSDIDIYCDKGNMRNLFDLIHLEEELEEKLGKEVDVVLDSSKMEPLFEQNIKKDLIELC